jgi:ABC-type Mn2+/Zn2+ transport system permease subunit
MVLERMALVGDALSHVALPGLALGILYGFNPFMGAFAFLFASAILIWRLERVTRLSFETIVGSLFTISLAVGILLIPETELLEALFGDISKVTRLDAIVTVGLSAAVMISARKIYDKLVLSMISEGLAASIGVKVARINLLYLLLVSVIVAMSIRIVGTLLVGFLVVVPAAVAKNASSNLSKYSMLSSLFGAISASSGILLSQLLKLPAGPLIVLSGIIVFLIALPVRRLTR